MNKLRIYLDNCCFNRPFDDQSYLSVSLETEAKLMIQALVRSNMLSLIWSFILDFENNAHPDNNIKEEIAEWRRVSQVMVYLETEILSYAAKLHQLGFGKKDALHIASACKAKADFFITVDKGIIKKSEHVKNVRILSPVDFIHFLEHKKDEE